jgi:gentisate 1,2-dioxygenase
MEEGDFLITPKTLWHGHEHVGDEPMIWMDALDIPTIYAIGGTFFEPYPGRSIEEPKVPDNVSELRYQGGMVRPIADRKSSIAPLANYKWNRTVDAIQGLTAFEPDQYDGFAVEYINPSNGKTANPTMSAWMSFLPSGMHTKAHRHTHSCIYHVKEGEGYSIINGVRFDWTKGDYFVVPNYAWHEHVATKDSYLFSVNDLPIMERFDIEQEEALESNNGKQEVKSEFTPVLV